MFKKNWFYKLKNNQWDLLPVSFNFWGIVKNIEGFIIKTPPIKHIKMETIDFILILSLRKSMLNSNIIIPFMFNITEAIEIGIRYIPKKKNNEPIPPIKHLNKRTFKILKLRGNRVFLFFRLL